MFRWLREWRRRRVLANQALDENAWRTACRGVRATRTLRPAEIERLKELTLLFLHEKDFIPAEGFDLQDSHRYAIALQACIPILHLGIEAYGDWRSIYIFPGVMRERGRRPGQGNMPEHIAGLAVLGGGVALAWSEAQRGFRDDGDSYNPIIHEFAHKLDMVDGAADGRPELPEGVSNREWCTAFRKAFDDFRGRLERGAPTRLDAYAATDPAEFFAVCSEVFFEEPGDLEAEYPRIADLLRAFYLRDRESERTTT